VDSSNDKPVPGGIAATAGGDLVSTHDAAGRIDVFRNRAAIDPAGARVFDLGRGLVGPSEETAFPAAVLATVHTNNIPTALMALARTCPGSFNVVNVPLVSRR